MAGAFVERLTLNDARIEAMARGVEEVAALPDPVGEVIASWRRPNGLEISQVRVPIGVIAIIYESRPNVTVDAGVLGLKAGNAVVLRGGKEALASNAFLAGLIARALEGAGIARDARDVRRKSRSRGDPDPEAPSRGDRSDHSARRQGAEGRARRIGRPAAAAFRRTSATPTSIAPPI